MSIQYDNYLENHRTNVINGYKWLKENLPEILGKNFDVEWQIVYDHDYSKNDLDEYAAYDAYFYGGNRSYKVVNDFRRAWLMHIHRNPHHWQHWILTNDNPDEGEIILDMDHNYIIEMICDWWAFSWNKENIYEIFGWYEQHKDYIKLSDKTRSTVEYILDKMKEKLDELQNGGNQ